MARPTTAKTESYGFISPGTYEGRILQMDEHRARSGNLCYKLVIAVGDGGAAGAKIDYYLSPNHVTSMRGFLGAVFPHLLDDWERTKAVEFDMDEAEGVPVAARVIVEEYQGKTRSKIDVLGHVDDLDFLSEEG